MAGRAFVGGLLAAAATLACDCSTPPVDQCVRDASAVFRGRVARIDPVAADASGRRRLAIHFDVGEVWKGPPSRKITLSQELFNGCSWFGFEAGKEYLIFARGGPALTAARCSGTDEIRQSRYLAKLGRGKRLGGPR